MSGASPSTRGPAWWRRTSRAYAPSSSGPAPATSSGPSAAPATSFKRPREVLRSASFRLGLLQAALFAVSVSVLVAVVYSRTVSTLAHQLDQDIRDDLADLAGVADRQGLPAAADAVERLLDEPERRPDAYYLLVDADGRRLAGNAPGVPTRTGWVDMPLSTRVTHWGRPKDREHVLR